MMNLWNRIRSAGLPFYPLLIGIYPVLYLWSANRAQQPAYVVLPALALTLAGLAAVYGAAFAALRDAHRAALVTALLSFYTLAYGHLSSLAGGWSRMGQTLLLAGSAVLVGGLVALVVVRKYGSPPLSRVLNFVSAALVVSQLAMTLPYYATVAHLRQKADAAAAQEQGSIPVTGGETVAEAGKGPAASGVLQKLAGAAGRNSPQRDVYFIMLDNYGRQDILLTGSKFDNSAFVDALEERGFVFPDCPQANYFATAPDMTSILNMDYLDALGIKESTYTRRDSYEDLAPYMQNSLVLRKFKAYGYNVVTFRGFMGLIDIPNSDVYVSFDKDLPINQRLETLKFQSLYLDTTIAGAARALLAPEQVEVEDMGAPLEADRAQEAEEAYLEIAEHALSPEFFQVYQQNLYAFDALERIPEEVDGPKFVYAHIYSTHWPFMLRPDGSPRLPFTKQITRGGYVDSVKYTNERVLAAIDAILANSDVPPVIILQGDHANHWVNPVEWSGTDRLKILSAFYLPEGGEALLYDTITPVNTFRLVFQHYFGEEIELLPDVSRYLDPKTRKVTETGPTCISDVIR